MLPSVTFVVASRQNIRNLPELCNHCLFPNGNGIKSEMDFITGFPRSQKGHDAIFVVVDRFSKVAHFLPVKETITASQLADLYVSRIVSLHGVPLEINSDRGSLFHLKVLGKFSTGYGNSFIALAQLITPSPAVKLKESTKFLKICFDTCVISFGKKWEESLPFAEFSYNNSYQASLKLGPFEVSVRT